MKKLFYQEALTSESTVRQFKESVIIHKMGNYLEMLWGCSSSISSSHFFLTYFFWSALLHGSVGASSEWNKINIITAQKISLHTQISVAFELGKDQIVKSSRLQIFFKVDFVKTFTNFTEKYMSKSLFNKVTWLKAYNFI